ncbi:MFS general substrate transporter [Massarina eburnea CBS 473.64]|uniref:MFS general substrate transporter n=1 Tax=Massarina eburnea CBS 473.64 TaxID=1395130 RepID=A0A6A6RIZ6_9PLEO|nr:MFS general substrate transporter [Massarina eburnea CBS 473.64]
MASPTKDPQPPQEKKNDFTSIFIPDHDPISISNEVAKEEEYFMSGIKLYILVISLSLAVLLMALDMSILVTAIPLITEKFQSTADIGWYVSGYLLTLCSLQPLSGKLYANFSLKYTLLSFFAFFELGSGLSGAATSSSMLITGRAVVVELRLRAMYAGIISSMFGIALIIGPLLGGAFTQHCRHPRSSLHVQATGTQSRERWNRREDEEVRSHRRNAIHPCSHHATHGPPMGRPNIPVVGGVILLLILSAWQYRSGPAAMIPPAILSQRSVFWACMCAMFGMGAQTLLGLWMPEWLQVIKGASPVQSGVRLLPVMLAQCVSSVISGIGITKLGYYNPWILLGTAFISVGSGLYTTLEVASGSAAWIGFQVVFGLGSGMFLTGPLLAIQGVLTPAEIPVGIATVTFFQMFGGALFSALSQTIFNTQLLKQLAQNVPDVDIDALLAAGTTAAMALVRPEQAPAILESYNTALLSPFYLGASVTAIIG